MSLFERFTPWILLSGIAVFAYYTHEWRRESLQSIKLTDKALKNSTQWENVASFWHETSDFWENEATNSAVRMETHLPSVLTNSSNLIAFGKGPTNCDDAWNLLDRSTWMLTTEASNGGGDDLYVYGQLIGKILNCKFVPFEPLDNPSEWDVPTNRFESFLKQQP